MQSRVLILQFLTAIAIFKGEPVDIETNIPARKPIAECMNALQAANPNLTLAIECLAQTRNHTAFFEDTLWKLDFFMRRILRMQTAIKNEVYVPSPYQHIDDVMKIKGSVARYNCSAKQHVIQAIRRRLDRLNLKKDVESVLFKWPYKQKSMKTDGSQLTRTFNTNRNRATVDPPKDSSELTCLILKAIERYSKV